MTTYNGCLPINQVESIYTATFGIQTHINIADLLERNKIIRVAPHVVNVIGNNKWMVWAPTGRPYPTRGRKASLLPLNSSEFVSPTVDVAIAADKDLQHVSGAMTGDTINVAEDFEAFPSSQPKPYPEIPQHSTPQDIGRETQALSDVTLPSASEPDSIVPTRYVETTSNDNNASSGDLAEEVVSKADVPSSDKIESSVDPTVSTSPASLHKSNGEVSAETYGFLEKTLEPELMAELRASGEQHQQREQTLSELLNNKPLSEQAIQLLIHFAKPMSEVDLEAGDDDNEDPEVPAETNQPFVPVDYLQSNMTPDQVLEEMRKLKESSGGYLSPEKMEPFLTYFGELSSRELDRLESLEEQEKPKPKKGASAKKKRVMAIRFPGKSPAAPPSGDDDPDPYKEQRLYSAELLKDKLPVVPDFENMSDSSDSDGSCPRPLEREEYIQTLLERGIPSLTDEDIIRAAHVVDKEARKKVGSVESAGTKAEWPTFEEGDGSRIDNNLPKPLVSSSEVGRVVPRRLFKDQQPVHGLNSHSTTDSNAAEWPYLM